MNTKKTLKNYRIKHILNNSSIIVDGSTTERILLGKGIGFGYKPADTLPIGTEYEKSYHLLAKASDFHRIINGYDDVIVEMVMDTIQQITSLNTGEFTTNDLVTIADHLAAMFLRLSNGEAILSFFSQETKTIYPGSFAKANDITKIIEEKHNVVIPEAEVAYIALYLENLGGRKTKKEVEQISIILEEMRELFEEENNLNIDRDSLAYSRFLIHIHLLVQSSSFRKTSLNSAINKAILSTYTEYTAIAKQLITIIERQVEHDLSESELIYLVIHLVNLFEERED